MATPNIRLIEGIRNTIKKLETGASYQWGHMGSCNCGHLAQALTNLGKSEIHARAMQRKGDWNEQCDDFCPTSGMAMDDLIKEMLCAGLSIHDLKHLEKLSDPEVLRNLPLEKRNLKQNVRQDVIAYMKSWAQLLENQLAADINVNKMLEDQPVSI